MVAPPAASVFPPCTSDACSVDDYEKDKVARAGVGKPTCEMTEKCVSACSAYGRVCPCAARIAAHAACEAMQDLKKNSKVFGLEEGAEGNECNENSRPHFTYLNADDLLMGDKLGEGGFSNVNHCILTVGDEAGQEFAVKYLKRKAMVDLHQFKHGAADLAVEAYFLETLNHPHIVKLHGVTAGSVETNFSTGKECGFFIVVDRLYDTLEKRLEDYRIEQERTGGNVLSRLSSEYKERKRQEFMDRIRMARDIADAVEYLHSLNIVYRDLKPDNIGFDKNGVLKLFDFGLAKELKSSDDAGNGRYKMTGNTGSRRYMAPEVAKEMPYNLSVDAYSFGILLWEICACEKPFYGYSSGKHMQQVVLGGERPKMDSQHTATWPANLQWLVTHCWSAFPCVRPSFSTIKSILEDILDGKECIPPHLLRNKCQPGEEGHVEYEKEATPEVDCSSPKFKHLFRSPKSVGNKRSTTTGSHPEPHEEGKIGPPEKGSIRKPEASIGRRRTWGFTLRK